MRNYILALSLLVILTVNLSDALANPPTAYEGRALYVSYCQLCHGLKGKGDGPLARAMDISPADLTTTVRSRSDTILKKIITGEGRQTITGRDRHNLLSDAMPEWRTVFDADQVRSLIAYLRFIGYSKYPLMGDPTLGKQRYQQYCSVCHGKEGTGDGIMTKLMGINPMDHTNPNETGRFSNEELVRGILEGKGRYMPAWKGILTQAEVEGLVSYIRLLSY